MRGPGAGGGGGGEGGRLAPPRPGHAGSGAGAVTADLVALRERIAAIAARPPRRSPSPPYPPPEREGEFQPPRGRESESRRLPANCPENATPFLPALLPPECFPHPSCPNRDAPPT